MSNPAHGYYPPPPAKKGLSPVVWILIAIGAFLVVAGIAIVATGVYFVKQAAANPIDAAAEMLASNSNVDVVSKHPERGLITVREKSTGKTVTVDLEQIKQGKLFVTTDGKEVEVEAGAGGVRVKSSDGETASIG